MNGCADLYEAISAYADSELNGSEAALVEEHLAVCGECRALLAFFRGITASGAKSAALPPETLCSNVMDAVRGAAKPAAAKKRGPARILLTRYLPIAACLAIILMALPRITNLYRQSDNEAGGYPSAGSYPSAGAVMPAPAGGGNDENAEYGPLMPNEDTEDTSVALDMDSGADSEMRSSAMGGEAMGSEAMVGEVMGDEAMGGESMVGEAMPEEPDSRSGADNAPRPEPDSAPAPAAGREPVIPESFYRAFAWIEISGEMPAFPPSYIPVQMDDESRWSLYYEFPLDVAIALIEELEGHDNVRIYYLNADGDFAIVLSSRE